ncbi:HlyD family secretion protein [Pedobacter panaciterrae]
METKKDILDQIELRSESVQDLLSEPPHWMFRWGNVIIFCAILMILMMSYLIRYPEFVPATIIVTSQNPTEKVEARTDSRIEKIFIKDHQKVKKDEVLMVLQSTANYKNILELKMIVDSISSVQLFSFPVQKISAFKLGELQSDYNAFAKAFQDEKLFAKFRPYAPEHIAASQNIAEYRGRIVTLKQQKDLELEKFELIRKNYQRSQKLFSLKVISTMELESERIKFLQAQQSLENINISISQTEEGISNFYKTKSSATINTEKDKINYASQTLQLFEQLRKSLKQWEQSYLIVSSTEGIASFQQFWGENQFIKRGDAILSVLPINNKTLIGKMSVSATNSGKIYSGVKCSSNWRIILIRNMVL